MSYLAIYRRFRPTSFDGMIGQEHVVTTLVNQIKGDRIGHAYLFCGARGTGKTTAAKIFARAINCLSPINGSPCGKCEACQKLANPTNLDILEIDAASNNKVENVREIRDNVQYPPVAGRFKVYIIDEVHMLTTEAFNALLKTLEEPPKHAVFVLATTEPHKLPATILSRCMRFDFHLVADKVIQELIEKIYDEVGKSYDKEAVALIAKSGEGSVRDALSVADLCLSSGEGKLTYNTVISLLGASDSRKTAALVKGILSGDVGECLNVTDELTSLGKSVSVLVKDVCSMLRDVMIVKTCAGAKDILSVPDDEFKSLKELSTLCDNHRLLRSLEIFTAVENDLKYSTHPKVVFETAAIKAAMPQEDYNQDALIARISQLEAKLSALEKNGIKIATSSFDKEAKDHGDKAESKSKKIEEKFENVIKEEVVAEESPKESFAEPDVKEEKRLAGFDYVSEDEARSIEESIPPVEDQIGFADFFETNDKNTQKPVNKSIIDSFIDKNQTQTTTKKEEKTAQREQVIEKVADSRLWGLVIRKLRADKHLMLWIACQELEAKIEDGVLKIYADGENEYNLLSKAESVQTLQETLNNYSPYKIQVFKAGAQKDVDDFSKEAEKANELFDGKLKIIE